MSVRSRKLLKFLVLAALLIVLSGLSYTPLWGGETCCPGGFCPRPSRPLVPVAPLLRPAATRPLPAVVRIKTLDRDGTNSWSSGTLVWRSKAKDVAIVLTCWHTVKDAVGQPLVTFPNGEKFRGRIVGTDSVWDLGAIEIRRPNVEPMAIAEKTPQIGERLTLAGYGSGRYRSQSGRVTQYVSPGKNQPFECVELAAPARQGDSGGPIINAQGRLAGVLFGTDDVISAGTYCGRVRWFLASVLGVAQPQQQQQKPQPTLPSLQPWVAPKQTSKQTPLLAMLKKQGAQIAALQVEVAALKRLVAIPRAYSDLPPIFVETMLDGKRLKLGKVYLGGVLSLPPITVQTVKDDVVIKTVQAYPGGDLLSLHLVPVNQTEGSK